MVTAVEDGSEATVGVHHLIPPSVILDFSHPWIENWLIRLSAWWSDVDLYWAILKNTVRPNT